MGLNANNEKCNDDHHQKMINNGKHVGLKKENWCCQQ